MDLGRNRRHLSGSAIGLQHRSLSGLDSHPRIPRESHHLTTHHPHPRPGTQDRAESPMKDLMKMMKQVQDIQGRMQQMQEELAALQVEGQSGGGLVRVTLNGKMEARAVKLDPSLVKPEDTEMLE